MNALVALLLLAAPPAPPLAESYPDAVEVYRADFAPGERHGYAAWPSDWHRTQGDAYPPYVRGVIRPETSPAGNYCLRFDLDGGAAAATSAPIAADDRHAYVLEGYIKTDQLVHDRAHLTLSFLDERGRVLETIDSAGVIDDAWHKVRLGPLAPRSARARFAQIGISLEPGQQQDLYGSAMFAGISLGRLPRLTVTLDGDGAFYRSGQPIVVDALVTGNDRPLESLEIDVLDVFGHPVAEVGEAFVGESRAQPPSPAAGDRTSHEVRMTWQGAIERAGYYRLRVGYRGDSGYPHQVERPLAIVEHGDPPPAAEFGWSMPHGPGPLTYRQLAEVLRQTGVGNVKVPVWSQADDPQAMLELADFAGALGDRGIGLVAVLDRPPASVREKNQLPAHPSLAEVLFSPAETWQASLDAPLLHIGLQTLAWQLGDDRDTTLGDAIDPAPMIAEVRKPFDTLLPGATLVLPVPARHPPLGDRQQHLVLSLAPEQEASRESFDGEAVAAGPRRWLGVDPLPAAQPLDRRVSDLVRRMIAARVERVPAVYLYDPLACGVLEPDGSPGELLIPWRTTAVALAGAEYLGELVMPGGSENRVFARGGQITLVVRNDQRTDETLYLGGSVWQTNVWGRTTEADRDGDKHVLHAGPLPTFVHGLSEPVTRFSLAVQLARPRLPSILGARQVNAVRVTNTFATRLDGEVKIVSPAGWRTRPDRFDLQLAPGETVELPVESYIPRSATTGPARLQFEFDVAADRPHRFTVYRNLELGEGDVQIELATRMTDGGDLQVEQRFVNNTDDVVAFKCLLFVPGQIRQRFDVTNLIRGDMTHQFVVPDGAALLGQTLWLRAEEIGGPRVLSYRFRAAGTEGSSDAPSARSARAF